MGAPHPDAPVIRWIALAGAGGAAAVSAIDHFEIAGPWASIALILALLAVVGISALGFAYRRRAAAIVAEASIHALESATKRAEFDALQQELEQHKRLERQLLEAKQAAEAATLAKGEFLATMSHEIRTPLNGILPMLDLLQSSPLRPEQQELVQTAYASASQLLHIVDDILDYSKLEANGLSLESVGLNLKELVDSVMRLMEKPAENKGLRLSLRMDPALRLALRGDPTRLRQVLTNLLSNAVKFTERGTVGLNVIRLGETRTHHEIRFEVRDTGIGIAPEAIGRLFTPFSQADASTTRLYGGTGLGLAISKRIVELMGGRIGVESEPGRGSLFWFEIPLLKTVSEIQGPRAELAGARMLVLTADPALHRRLSIAIPNWGVTASFVSTTQDALDRLRSAVSRGPSWAFHILLADLGPARSTALALHRNIRRLSALDTLHIVYLQGDEPLPEELREGAGVLVASRHLGDADLRVLIASHLGSERGASSRAPVRGEPAAAEPVAPPPLPAASRLEGHVLLVEDNPVNLMVSQRLLGLMGLSCDTAANGKEALARLAATGYDAVLMDCQMPVLDGYAATRQWRRHEAAQGLARTPIIAMTANAMAGDRQRCLDAGMDDYLAKPVTRSQLEQTLALWLGTRTGAAAPSAGAAATAAATSAAVPPGKALDRGIVDDLRDLMGEEFLQLVRVFLEDAPFHLDQLEQAARNGDIAGLVAPAHTMKSASANLGALLLSSQAKRIELGARQRTLENPRAAVAALREAWRSAERELRELLRETAPPAP
ncbi:MAG: ATP-binding protein [Rehaibacterium terrae]|uniref:hybrid sensor histidine kinase/response regulator n=1 Tax=Rehaibacterium terrae TaxID=1341696 RepID=UPI003918A846